MEIKLLDFWQRNRPELDNVLEAGEFTANTTAAGLGLAIALGVVGTTALPVAGVAAAGLGFAGSTRKVIEFVAKRWNKKLTLEEVASLVTPVAYLDSFNYWLGKNQVLAAKIKPEQSQEIQIDSKIENLTLDHQLAINALSNFPASELAQTFNQILSSRLISQGLDEMEAHIIVSWVAWKTIDFFDSTLAEFRDSDNLKIINIYRNTVPNEDSRQYTSIEIYLAKQIATKPRETVFNEEFSFEDIYVPLKAAPVDTNGKVEQDARTFVVEEWATETLLDPNKAKQVMFIQAGPGRGKSVFCRMFADLVRQKIHPLWIPVVIRLRDIESFEQSFAKTLQGAVKADFAQDEGWLTDSKLRFLFLLDGFDELRMEGRAKGGVERFITQVGSYQKLCDTSEMGHRFIVTGRQLALQGISYLPENLERVELLSMDDDLQGKWFDKWQQVVDQDQVTANRKVELLKGFLQSRNLPDEVKQELAREPLLLYLLAAMHRDGKISVADLSGTSGIQTKITIYEQALNWVLTEQRKPIQQEIVRLDKEELSQVLIEAGLCVVQSGGECARVKMIAERLQKSEPEIVEKIDQIQNQDQDEVLKNALAAFYLKPAAGDEGGSVEFFHKSFGEFLCAKRMQQALEDWIVPGRRGRGFNLNDEQLAEEIYDLWGYGGLTKEIMEYLWGLLTANKQFSFEKLFHRLEDFYERWCDGEFIDADGTTFPQAKMRRLKERKPEFDQEKDSLGQRQVDVYTGLNVMILLFELHRYGQQQEELKEVINFHPCGKRNQGGQLENEARLFNIMGYSCCLSKNAFLDIVGRLIRNADLSGADLRDANLRDADLSDANLRDANLRDADLRDADLSDANLISANLISANLISADLSGADLRDANLRDANLISADLSGADLSGADLRDANLSGANLISADLISANLISANLSGADLRDANLISADLISADLRDANLSHANLSHANLDGAYLSGANLGGANLISADLSDAYLISANLISADLSGANLSGANLSGADLSGANLSGADLSGAYLSHANLSHANLEGLIWNENTNWSNVQGLDSAINIPAALKDHISG
ncbi:MAG: pentapeptide repeat-containing protein [Cyanobacteria bacterium P01_G01_bin.39]